jgi:dienelactone hydrolase
VVLIHGGIVKWPSQQLREYALGTWTSGFLAAGYVVVAITYRGRDIDPQSLEAVNDAVAAISYLRRLSYVDGQSIVVSGTSGGGDLALWVAASTPLAAIVAEESASSMFMGMITKDTPKKGDRFTPEDGMVIHANPAKFFTPESRKVAQARMAAINCPILIVQGEETSRLNVFRVERLPLACRTARWSTDRFDAIPEASQFTDHLGGAPLRPMFGDGRTALLVGNALVQNLPNEPTEPIGDGANGLRVAETWNQPTIHELKNAAFGFDGGIGRLIEHSAHLAVAVRRAVTVIHARALLLARTRADPRGEMLGRWKGRGHGSDFRDDLVRGSHAQAGHLGQALYGRLMRVEEPRHFTVQLCDVVFDHAQFVERQLQQPPVDGMQVRAGADRVSKLVGRGVEPPTAQAGDRRGIRFAIRERLQHPSRTGAKEIRHQTRPLDVRFLQQAFQPVLQLDAVARDLVLPAHHRPPEPLLHVRHKAERQLLRHQALHQPLGIGKILLPPTGAAIRLGLCQG